MYVRLSESTVYSKYVQFFLYVVLWVGTELRERYIKIECYMVKEREREIGYKDVCLVYILFIDLKKKPITNASNLL